MARKDAEQLTKEQEPSICEEIGHKLEFGIQTGGPCGETDGIVCLRIRIILTWSATGLMAYRANFKLGYLPPKAYR
jgi:hypothetical protein